MKLIFCDTNKELLKKVEKVFRETINHTHCELIISKNDLLETKKEYKEALIATASNPSFTMNGGIDRIIKNNYPDQCENTREFKFTKDLFFTITCDENIKTNKKIIQRALLGIYFASRKNDIIFTGLGTGVAGLSEDDFIDEVTKFISADFRFVAFSSADFCSVDFRSVDFSSVDFSYADFSYVDFRYADFRFVDFSFVNFSFTDFRYADFSSADFSSVDFRSVIHNYKITPQEGEFIGWKKSDKKILKLKIINAKNVSGGLIGRKLRTDKVEVLEIQDINGNILEEKEVCSDYNKNFIYRVGEIIEEKKYIHSDLVECVYGIHFFITREEAVDY